MSNEVEDELIQALQGDEDAIRSVAQRLNQREEAIAGHTVHAVNTMVTNRKNALAAFDHFKSEFDDIADSPEWFARAKELEAAEAARNPNDTNFLQRFRKVGFRVRRERDGDEGRDHASAIRQMRKGRPAAVQVDDETEEGEEPISHERDEREMRRMLAADAEHEATNSERIAEMIAERRGQRVQAGD